MRQGPLRETLSRCDGVFGCYGDEGKDGMNMRRGFTERLTFAWEGNGTAARAIELAESALIKADTLIVVGYSFPAFNRLVDQRLLRSFSSGRRTMGKLVIQHPSLQETDLKNMFDLDWNGIDIKIDRNKDQFHLPSELFVG